MFEAIDEHSSATEFMNAYKVNEYEQKLTNVYNYGLEFVETTFVGINTYLTHYYKQYSDPIISNGSAKLDTIEYYRKKLQETLIDFKNYFEIVVNYKTPIVVVNEKDRLNFKNTIEEAMIIVDLSTDKSFEKQKDVLAKLSALNITDACTNICKQITQIRSNSNLINQFDNTIKKVNNNRVLIIEKIDSLKNDSSIKNIQSKITDYKLLSETFSNYVTSTILLHITKDYETSEYSKFANYDFKNFNEYQYNERLTKCNYYIENNVYDNSFSNNLAFNQKSNIGETNAYDFTYFSMEICTVIIIVFAMMLMCNLITGETESGTIKLLLVRPYRRSKIITSKLFATLFFVIIFMLFSATLSFIGGYFMFGAESLPILAIFNASSTAVMHPLTILILDILFLLLDVLFYVIIALLLAILFKNYAGAITTSLVIVIVMFVLNLLSNGAFWYTLLPGMNLHLFKFFGNAFVPLSDASVLQNVLITGIESSMTFVYSILMYIAYSAIFITMAYTIFAKRDF